MKTTRLLLIGFLFVFSSLASTAQTISRSVIGSAGSNSEQLSFTVGETVIETANSPDFILTQGFQQPEELMGTFIDPILGEASFVLYPNPAQDNIILQIETEKMRTLHVSFTDIRGRAVTSNQAIEVGLHAEHNFDVSTFSIGNYVLLLKNEQGEVLKSFRFEKRY